MLAVCTMILKKLQLETHRQLYGLLEISIFLILIGTLSQKLVINMIVKQLMKVALKPSTASAWGNCLTNLLAMTKFWICS